MSDSLTCAQPTLHDLYRDHGSWLESWLSRRLGNAWDAADLSQDTFLRVLASAQPIGQLQEPRAYLVTLGKRLLSNFYQRRSLEKAYLEAWPSCQRPARRRPSSAGYCWRRCRRWMNCSMACLRRCAGPFC